MPFSLLKCKTEIRNNYRMNIHDLEVTWIVRGKINGASWKLFFFLGFATKQR